MDSNGIVIVTTISIVMLLPSLLHSILSLLGDGSYYSCSQSRMVQSFVLTGLDTVYAVGGMELENV